MGHSKNLRYACFGLFVFITCGEEQNPPPLVNSLTPSVVSAQNATTVTLRGENLYSDVRRFDLDENSAPEINEEFSVSVDRLGLLSFSIRSVTPSAIVFDVPATIFLGTYDIVVIAPDGRTATLSDGLTIVASCMPDECGDGCCGTDETLSSCPADCSIGCGDGICLANETASTCPTDCMAGCGDGDCASGEDTSTCPADCMAGCGDGDCASGEDASTCSVDCLETCGDLLCTGTETPETCASDCQLCSESCSTGRCTDSCGPGCSLQCDDGCGCAIDCSSNSGSCGFECRDDSVCNVDCSDSSSCKPICMNNSECKIDCTNGNACEIDCVDDAQCLVDCNDANVCGFKECSGAELSCLNNIMVCNRDCP